MNKYSLKIGDTALITTDAYFFAPNGTQYRAVFGTIHNVVDAEDSLGIKTNERSTNWYVEIGNMIVAGCQIHYAIKTNNFNPGKADGHYSADAKHGVNEYRVPSGIYNADDEY